MKIKTTINKMRGFFYTGQTKNPNFRIEHLKTLRENVLKYKPEIQKALYCDLNKSPADTMLTEISPILNEIDFAVKNLKNWAKTAEVETVPFLKPAKTLILKEPFGIVLIVAPSGNPLRLSLTSLVGAIAAGNCAIIRTSCKTPEVSKVLNRIITETFGSNYVKMLPPDEISGKDILQADFDYIFFTGSSQGGRQIAKIADERIIPYTIELEEESSAKSDAMINHTAEETLTLEGIRASEAGRFHGKYNFYIFSRLKSVLISSTERKDDIFSLPFTNENPYLVNRFY